MHMRTPSPTSYLQDAPENLSLRTLGAQVRSNLGVLLVGS